MPGFQLKNKRYNIPQQTPYPRYIKQQETDGKAASVTESNTDKPAETHGSYGALILHPNWKAKRKEVIERDQFKCVICGSSKELQVHHRQYHFVKATQKFKVPWDYPGHLLITLCSSCHSRGHSKFKVPSIHI
jgi:5-methylcytosine-specific restriction endonuclease McrA